MNVLQFTVMNCNEEKKKKKGERLVPYFFYDTNP